MKKLLGFIAIIMLIGLWSFFRSLGQGESRAMAAENDRAAEQILRSTVRLHLQAWQMQADESGYWLDESIGHATLGEDHVLVTHNHYPLLEQEGLIISVAFFAADGRRLFSAPLNDFEIRQAGPETLHFVLKYDYLAQQFAQAGIVPAQFAGWQELDLQPGTAVGQVDWDGERTRVDWVQVEQISHDSGVPRLVVDDGIMQGASGGGLFVNGRHVANNWYFLEQLDGSGHVVHLSGVGALN